MDELSELTGAVFAVADTPYCCWDWDLRARTVGFLDGLDSEYFGHLAEILATNLGTERDFVAATALRVTYQQSLETLMSLLGAHAQAPNAAPAWIARCSTTDLVEVVNLAPIEDVDRPLEVARLPSEPIEVVDQDTVDQPTVEVGEEALEFGSDDSRLER